MTGIRPSNSTFTNTQDVMDTSTETAARGRYVNILVIFSRGCDLLLFSTTKSSFEFWLHQAYQAVSEMVMLVLSAVLNVGFFTCIILYIYIYIYIYRD